MIEQLKFYADSNGLYLGAMGGELLESSPHPYPEGIEVSSAPDSMACVWDFSSKAWIEPETSTNE